MGLIYLNLFNKGGFIFSFSKDKLAKILKGGQINWGK